MEIFFTLLTFAFITNFIANLYLLIKQFRENVKIEHFIISHVTFFVLFALYLVYSIYFYNELFVITLLRFFSYIFVLNILFFIIHILFLIAKKANYL
ncbi:MAG: hypothetical protein QXL82_03400 [Candidatus Aenigmatarchaeota archaeon]